MQNFGGNMNQGALSPTSSSMSGSSARSANELNQQLVTENASMDYRMRNLELKMQGKQEQLKNLLEEKTSNLASLENLKKRLTLLQDRESSLAVAITRIRDNNIVSEGLESAVIQNLKAIKISNEEKRSKWDTMLKEHTATMNSHQEIYSSLPWVKEKKTLAVQVEKKRIFLERLKWQEEENRSKQTFFEKVSGERMKIEIIKLSQLMVRRNSELKRCEELQVYQRALDEEIEAIERQKKDIEDDISTRTKEMMRRIVDRSNVKEKITPSDSTKEMKTVTSFSSVRDRLGISNKKEEPKGMLTAASLRDRLSSSNKVLNQRSCPDDYVQPPPSSQQDMVTQVNSPSVESDEPNSPHLIDMPSSPPTVDDDLVELHSTRSENEATQTVLLSPPAQRSELMLATSLPEISTSSSHLSRPAPLKEILRPPVSLGARKPVVSSQTTLPSFAKSLALTQNELSVPPTVTTFATQSQATVDDAAESSPDDSGSAEPVSLSGQQSFKRPSEIPRPLDAKSQCEPKKSKIESVMPPKPKTTRRLPKPKKVAAGSGQLPKNVKRVSFVTGSQTHLGGNSTISQLGSPKTIAPAEPATESVPTSDLPPAHPDTTGQHQTAPNQPTSTENVLQPSPQTVSVSAANQPSPSGADEFPPPFASPPPQSFTGPDTPQGTSGNFESIFGAIFNSPQTPNDSMGFQFPIGGDAQKKDTSQGQPQPSSAPPGQDFFSFFGTANTDKSNKASFSDNFFKLF